MLDNQYLEIFQNNPYTLTILIGVGLFALWVLQSGLAAMLSEHLANKWTKLPPMYRGLLKLFFPQLEQHIFTIWKSVREEIKAKVENTPTPTDDIAFKEFDKTITKAIDNINPDVNISDNH